MKAGTVLLALAGFGVAVVAGAVALGPPAKKPAPAVVATPVAATPAPAGRTLVYYFHGNYRCSTCRTIEAFARETLTSAFGKDLETQRIAWQTVNVDEPASQHFIQDFQLYTRSLVVVDAKDPKHFKVLDRVWELVRDKPAFQKYVEQEIRGFGRS